MSMWFLDASVLLAREDRDDEEHEAARRLFSGSTALATLDLAFYEVSNVALRAWDDPEAADRLQGIVDAVADDGGLVRVDAAMVSDAAAIANRHEVSVYDAAYVAGASIVGARLVSCDLRDLVSRALAVTPRQACESELSA